MKILVKSVLFLGAAIGAAAPLLAQTALTQSFTNTTTGQITATQQQISTVNGAVNVGNATFSNTTTLIPLSRFNASTGILVGARVNVTIPYTVSVSATGLAPASGTGRTVDVESTVRGSVSIAGTSVFLPTLAATGANAAKCNAGDCANQSTNNTRSASGTFTGSASVATLPSLTQLYGAGPGTVNASTQINATGTLITKGTGMTDARATTTFIAGSTTPGANSYGITYDYVNFANPSFTPTVTPNNRTTTVNLGTRFVTAGPVSQNITLTNIGNANSAGVAVDSVSRATNNANLGTNLTTIANLAGGSSQNIAVSLTPLSAGVHTETFTLNARDKVQNDFGVGMQNYSLTVNASATVLNHATASFTSVAPLPGAPTPTLDFGTISNRAGVATRSFSIFNLGDINTAALELYNVTGPGNLRLSSNISPFLSLAAGQSNSFSVNFNPLDYIGAINGSYRFFLRDNAPGAVGGRNYELTLNVIGNVFDPVPEPGTWLTMLLGFGMVGAVARRRAVVRA